MQAETTEDAAGDDSAHCSHCTGSAAAAAFKKVQTGQVLWHSEVRELLTEEYL